MPPRKVKKEPEEKKEPDVKKESYITIRYGNFVLTFD